MNIQDLNIGDRFFAMFIGPTGTTKTTNAASFYEHFEPLDQYIHFFMFDGVEKIKILKTRFPNAKNIQFTAYGPREFPEFERDFNRVLEDPKCGLMVIDSFTSFSITTITYMMQAKGHGMVLSTAKAGVKTTGSKGGIVLPDWTEFNGEATIATELIDYCKASNKHVIMIAHPILRTGVSDDGGMKAKKYQSIVAYGPKAAEFIPGYFSEIYCFEIKQGLSDRDPTQTLIYTSPRNGFPGRTNLGLPDPVNISDKTLYQVLKEETKRKDIKFMER